MQSKIKVVFIDAEDVVQEIEIIDPADYDVSNGVHRREMGVRLATQVENIWKRQVLLFAEAAGLTDSSKQQGGFVLSPEEIKDMVDAHSEGLHTPPDGTPREGCPECEAQGLRA